jgi:hypothetical protein
MARIVPDAHFPVVRNDSEIVRALQNEIDFVENVRPSRELEKGSELFLELINSDNVCIESFVTIKSLGKNQF